MIPGKYNIKINRGSDYKVSFTGTDSDGDIDYGAKYTSAKVQVRPPWVSSQEDIIGDPLATWSTTTGEITIAGLLVTLSLTAAQTAALPFSEGSYSLELYYTDTVEHVDAYMYGLITVDFERTL